MRDMPFSRPSGARGLLVLLPLSIGACAAPMTQMGTVSPEQVAAEEQRQMLFTLEQFLQQEVRAHAVAYPLLRGAVGLCPNHVGYQTGIFLTNAPAFTKAWQPAARTLGYGDTITVAAVAAGGAAERAGLQVADRIVAVNGHALPPGAKALQAYGEVSREGVDSGTQAGVRPTLTLDLIRQGAAQHLTVPMDTVCNFQVTVQQGDEINAFADGQTVYLTRKP